MKKKNVVLEQIRKYKWGYLFGIILVAMDAIVTYIYPQLITNILDKAVPAKDPGAVISNVAYMAICQLVSITVALALSYLFCKMSNGFIVKIKLLLIQAMFQVDGKEIEKKSNLFMTSMNADVNNIEMLILQKEQQLIIGRTLEKLKEKDKAIFIMYYYRYKKIEEIAEILKMNPQTVKTRLRRGREILKRILLEEGYDASEI